MNNALVIYDNLTVDNPNYKQRVVDITEFFVYSPNGFDLFRTGNLTETALGLAQRGYKWMFVNILGHCVDRADIYLEAIAEAETNNYPMMGHLVYYPGAYPTVDSQFFLINLKQWSEVGFPEFEAVNNFVRYNTREVLRSEENFHDDYTPYWIRSGDRQRTYNIYQQLFNQRVVRAFLEAGYTLGNFNQSIRDRKWNLYAQPNQEQLQPFFERGEVVYPKDRVPQIIERILNERHSLSDTVYVLNSEEIYQHTPRMKMPIDHYIGVAGGFKGVLLLKWQGFTESTEITYVDVSVAGLNYQRYLISHWDGDISKYKQIVDNYQDQHPEFRYAWRSWNSWDNEIQGFLTQAKLTAEEFQTLWNQYRRLKHHFITVNLLEDRTTLIEHLKNTPGNNCYMWLSNAFDMQWTRFMLGKQYTVDQFTQLKEELKTTGRQYLVESVGQFYNC